MKLIEAQAPRADEAVRAAGLTASQYGGTRMVPGLAPSCHTRNDGGRIPNAFSAGLTVNVFFISLDAATSIASMMMIKS